MGGGTGRVHEGVSHCGPVATVDHAAIYVRTEPVWGTQGVITLSWWRQEAAQEGGDGAVIRSNLLSPLRLHPKPRAIGGESDGAPLGGEIDPVLPHREAENHPVVDVRFGVLKEFQR